MSTSPPPPAAASPQRWRMRIALALTVLFGLLLIVANHAGWLATTVLDTESFVGTLAPIPSDPDVSRALGEAVADNIIQSNEVGQAIVDKLPDGLAFAAIPLTQGLRDLIADIATKIVRSEPFAAIWERTLELTHRATLLYLRGVESDLITSAGGYVVLDLTDMGAIVNEKLDELGFTALDDIELDLTIALFKTTDGGIVQTLATVIYSIRWFSIALTMALLAAAYAVATDRRKLTVWVGSATVVAMIVSLIDGRLLKSLAGGVAEDPVREAGITAAGNIVFSRFVTQSWIILWLGALVATIAWLMGDPERARSLKAVFANTARGATADDSDASPFVTFVASNRRLLEWGTIVVAGGWLLLAPLPSFAVVLAGFTAAIVLVAVIEYIALTAEQQGTGREHARRDS